MIPDSTAIPVFRHMKFWPVWKKKKKKKEEREGETIRERERE